jgi:hypothetical protein
MRRVGWAVALLVLVACGSPAQTGSGGTTVAPSTSPSPTVVQCAWRYDQRNQPEVAAKLAAALVDAGVQGATATVQDLGESCGDRFAKMYGVYVMMVPVPDLADSANLDALTAKAASVVRSFSSSASDRISVVFESGGKRETRQIQKGT